MAKKQITGRTHASAVSKQLRMLGYSPYGAHETRHGGYIVREWAGAKDTEGGKLVKVHYDGIHRELKGPLSRKEVEREKARLERMHDMADDLKSVGYFVVWGWDAASGEVDYSFLVVSGSPARRKDVPEEEEVVMVQEETQEAVQAPSEPSQDLPTEPGSPRGAFPLVPLVTPEDAEEGVTIIRETAKTNPEAARRMEAHLYYLALVAVVSGADDATDVAATVLQTQGILLPR